MRSHRVALVVAVFILTSIVSSAQQIPAGTVLPIMLSTSVDSAKSKPGEIVRGKLMQDVVLASGEKIPTGAKVVGTVQQAPPITPSSPVHLVVRFDHVVTNDKQLEISTGLRALASMNEVFTAQLPTSTFDEYGTSISDWTTVQVGGAAVYHGDGTVREALDIVGRTTEPGVVTAKLVAAPKRGCPADAASSASEQALWVFSPWACGPYGYEDLSIARSNPNSAQGLIELTSPRPFKIRAGSGWLLQVTTSALAEAAPAAQ